MSNATSSGGAASAGGSATVIVGQRVKRGRADQLCGTFVVAGAKTVVTMNAPFRLKEYDGWVVTRSGTSAPLLTT